MLAGPSTSSGICGYSHFCFIPIIICYIDTVLFLRISWKTAHSSEVSFSCPDCTCVFDSERKLAMHQASHTRQEKATTGTLSEPKVSGDRADGTFACTKPLCTYQTLWKNMMDDHIAVSCPYPILGRCEYK